MELQTDQTVIKLTEAIQIYFFVSALSANAGISVSVFKIITVFGNFCHHKIKDWSLE